MERFLWLSYMASDFLTILSSSAEVERSVGHMMSPLRNRLVAMAQCLRSWSKSGLYISSLPSDLLDDKLGKLVADEVV